MKGTLRETGELTDSNETRASTDLPGTARVDDGLEDELHSVPAHKQAAYSVSEVSQMTGISGYTLRYYDKCGFFPNLSRDKHKAREFSDDDIAWLRLVDALRRSGLSIDGIAYFVRLSSQGKATFEEQFEILEAQEKRLEYQQREIVEGIEAIRLQKELTKAQGSNLC